MFAKGLASEIPQSFSLQIFQILAFLGTVLNLAARNAQKGLAAMVAGTIICCNIL